MAQRYRKLVQQMLEIRTRKTATLLETVFTRAGKEIFVYTFAVLSARSIGAGMKQAVDRFQKECPGIAFTDAVTIHVREAKAKRAKT
ncbi:hypothetical protein SB748_28240 [Rhizobium sp. SIMBA_035]